MLLGLAKGKVGDLVFYRDGGEQRTRTRVVPKNPRSAAQMGQRVRMANVPAFYRTLQFIMKDSFSNRPSNQSGYNAFARGAIEISPFMTKEMALAGSVLPAPYLISKGVIPSVPFSVPTTAASPQVVIDVRVGETLPTTLGQVSQLLIDSFPQLQVGDELHFIMLACSVDEVSDGVDVHSITPYVKTLTLDVNDATAVQGSGFSVAVNGITTSVIASHEGFGGAVVVSRSLADGRLSTSTAVVALDETSTSLYEGYRTSQSLAEAIDSYGRGEESLLR